MYYTLEYIPDENVEQWDGSEGAIDTMIVQDGSVDLYISGWRGSPAEEWWIDQVEVILIGEVDLFGAPAIIDWEEKRPGLVSEVERAQREYRRNAKWQKVWQRMKSYVSRPWWRSLEHNGRSSDR